ncbi:MAG: DUF2794 domain-containing protein, partial [Parvularculaceae bacterium]
GIIDPMEALEPSGQQAPRPSASTAAGGAATGFTRPELVRILGLYGQLVAAGEWRDYAIDLMKDAAVFSIFRRASEVPIYRIEKRPKLADRQGAWMVVSMTGAILKRGHDVAQVLKVFDRRRLRLAAE